MKRAILMLACLGLFVACGDDGGGGGGADVTTGDVATTDVAVGGDVLADTGTGGEDAVVGPDQVSPDVVTTVDTPSGEVAAPDTAGGGPNLACLAGPIEWPAAPAATADVTFVFKDFMQLTPLEGATVNVCARYDFACAAPLDSDTTDADGLVTLTLPTAGWGFDGRIESAKDTYLPLVWMAWPPVAEPFAEPRLLRMASVGTANLMGTLVQATLDPTRGHITPVALDCDGTPAAGLLIEAGGGLAEDSKKVYVEGQVPSLTATATDETGAALGVNLVPGWWPLYAVVDPEDGPEYGRAMVLVKPGAVTAVQLAPEPLLDARLECIGEVDPPAPDGADANLQGRAVDAIANTPLAGVTVNACDADPCDTPLDTATTTAEGEFDLTVPLGATGFTGWLEFSGPTTVSTIYHPRPVITRDTFKRMDVPLLSTATMELFGTLLELTPDPARGHLLLVVEDCDEARVSGATFSAAAADGDTVTAYADGLAPSTDATETDESGIGALFNVPVGTTTVEADLGADNIGSVEVLVRAGWMTQTSVRALP